MNTKDMVYVSMFAAIMCVLGFIPNIPIPLSPVPITVQTLGVMLAGGLLGARLGGLSLLVFLAIVAVGAPVLSGGRGGLSVFIGPTAGYLWSFPVAAFIIGYLTERLWDGLTVWKAFLVNFLGGALLMYAIGTPVVAIVTNIGMDKAIIANFIYLPGDLIKSAIAAYIAVKIKAIRPMIEKDKTTVA